MIFAAAALWLAISDVHLDPFGDSRTPSNWGSDSNVALFESSLAAMHRALPDPAVVIVPGDFYMHHFPASSNHAAVMKRIVGDFRRTFPNAQFAIALGNNDASCGDYRSEFGSANLAAIARLWKPLVDRNGTAPEFERDFGRYGYYASTIASPRVRLLAIDTVPFSSLYRGDCAAKTSDASSQLRWLRGALQKTPAGTRNVLLMHVPPGYDVYATEYARGFVPWPLMRLRENVALAGVLGDPRNRIAFAIAGHQHRFDIRLASNVPIVDLGSLSPVYQSDPAFYVLHVGARGVLDDIETWKFDEQSQHWLSLGSFDRTWGTSRVDAPSFALLHERLAQSPDLRRQWDAQAAGLTSDYAMRQEIWGDRWRIPWCAQTVLGAGFAHCARLERRVAFFDVVVALAAVAIGGCIALLVLRLRRRGLKKPRFPTR